MCAHSTQKLTNNTEAKVTVLSYLHLFFFYFEYTLKWISFSSGFDLVVFLFIQQQQQKKNTQQEHRALTFLTPMACLYTFLSERNKHRERKKDQRQKKNINDHSRVRACTRTVPYDSHRWTNWNWVLKKIKTKIKRMGCCTLNVVVLALIRDHSSYILKNFRNQSAR